MSIETEGAEHQAAEQSRQGSEAAGEDRSPAPRPVPDVTGGTRRDFRSDNGPTVPFGVAMFRGSPIAAGLGPMLDGAAQIQAELARFGAQRVHRALEAQSKMFGCQSSMEMRAAQQAYLTGLAEDYTEEWRRIYAYGLRLTFGQAGPMALDGERHATPV